MVLHLTQYKNKIISQTFFLANPYHGIQLSLTQQTTHVPVNHKILEPRMGLFLQPQYRHGALQLR